MPTVAVDVERLQALREVLRGRARRARAAAREMDKNAPAAAALRGKAKGLNEASDALVAIMSGNPLPLVNPRLVRDRAARLRERRRVENTRSLTSGVNG